MINHPSRVEVYEMFSLIPSPGLSSWDGLLHSRAGVELNAMVYLISELGLNSCDGFTYCNLTLSNHSTAHTECSGVPSIPRLGGGHAHNYALPIFGTNDKCLYNYMT